MGQIKNIKLHIVTDIKQGSKKYLHHGYPKHETSYHQETSQAIHPTSVRPSNVRRTLMEATQGYRLPCPSPVQGTESHREHRLWKQREDPTHDARWVPEVCRPQRERSGLVVDVERNSCCGDCSQCVRKEEKGNCGEGQPTVHQSHQCHCQVEESGERITTTTTTTTAVLLFE